MGYYATGTGTLSLKEGVGEIDLGETMSSWDEGWEESGEVWRVVFAGGDVVEISPVWPEVATT